jgi:hypothetical protein
VVGTSPSPAVVVGTSPAVVVGTSPAIVVGTSPPVVVGTSTVTVEDPGSAVEITVVLVELHRPRPGL